MRAIFISDAHLRRKESASYAALMNFLAHIRGSRGDDAPLQYGEYREERFIYPIRIDCLFILGDFFDFWFHRGNTIYPDFRFIVDRLRELRKQGVLIYLCEGNHDFFMESYFSAMLGMTVFTDWGDVEVDGQRILISHGDTIDEENRKYLLLRSILRSNLFYRLQMILPLSLLWRMARTGSDISKELSAESEEALVGKMRSFALTKFRKGFDAVILGHCHKPILEEHVINGRKKTFVTLGDWIDHYTYLTYEDGRFTLSHYQADAFLSAERPQT